MKKINNAKKAGGYSIIEIDVKETKNEREKSERKQTKRNTIEELRDLKDARKMIRKKISKEKGTGQTDTHTHTHTHTQVIEHARNLIKIYHLENAGLDERIILKMIEKQLEYLYRINLVQDTESTGK